MPYTWTWTDPDGVTTPLWVEYDVEGVFGPPVAVEEEPVPGQPGTRFRDIRHEPREFVLPLYLYNDAPDPSPLHSQIRALVVAMDSTRGEGQLRVVTPLGDQREIRCRAVAGLDVKQSRGEGSSPRHQRLAVMFRAFDPYWYATSDVLSPEYITGAQATFFPILPVRLSSSEVFADIQVDNTGDLECWPVWYITGPGTSVTVRNLSTGKYLTTTFVLAVGEIATIDTRPGHKTVVRSDGLNLFGYIVGSLWPLRRGSNALRVEMGAATAASKVQLSYRFRYLTA